MILFMVRITEQWSVRGAVEISHLEILSNQLNGISQ